MASHSYENLKKKFLHTIILLAVITVVEVFIALYGKGYIVEGVHWNHFWMGSLMVVMSLVKAYFIIFIFMHLKYEMPGMVRSILFPTLLLVWAIIAFLMEGKYWGHQRTTSGDDADNQEYVPTGENINRISPDTFIM
ncbi:MAG TPA: cytochrome C oxidase subunit IV family protein [Saprospiraceae bacterium]|nr:cytochrome C oxidase subunit IV family protein [Saprospiraceae bacterium]MCB9328721.1 cytochrome C oxidase subunit IV family protein [Lewinellaceae bacterium]HPQ21870.1 cytochrome C oxidase subunit IV family protein [Saprospiraceae bacterium]HRX29211.1 cytochrome C oxidase subunit IV family protein [Saprospiraceae bacterium]